MGQYIAMRPRLMSRQFKQRLLAEEAERQAAEDAAIMAALLIEERARKAAIERVMAEDKARRLAFRPHRPPKLSQQEHAYYVVTPDPLRNFMVNHLPKRVVDRIIARQVGLT
jgi:hypothetical protein